ncbi:MAG: methyltransferase [Sphingomonas taxi]
MRLLVSMIAGLAMTTAVVAQDKTASAGAAIARALADPARADQAGDDARRQAAAVLAFSGVKPGDTVVDYLPGSGYWTRIFTNVVGPRGRVYALWPAAGAKYAEKNLPALNARGLANVTAQVQPTNLPSASQPVDLFWTVQNYHDIPNKGAGEPALRAFDAAVFKMLKSGGTYVVIDHADAPGTGLSGTETRHRIDPRRRPPPDRGDRLPLRRREQRSGQPGGRSYEERLRPGDPGQDRPVRDEVPQALIGGRFSRQ